MSEAIEQYVSDRRKQTIGRLVERLSEIYKLTDGELDPDDALEVIERVRKLSYQAIAEMPA